MAKKGKDIDKSVESKTETTAAQLSPTGGVVKVTKGTLEKTSWKESSVKAIDKKGNPIKDACGKTITGPPDRIKKVQAYVNSPFKRLKRKPTELQVCHQ